jgi:hypothetical protein
MRKLNLLAVSVGAALVGAAVPASLHWSPTSVTLLSLDTAEAKVGRPLTPVSVAGANRRANRRGYRAAAGVAAAGAVAAGAAAAGAYYAQPAADPYADPVPAPYYAEPVPAPYYGPGPAIVAPPPVVVLPAPAAGYVEPGYQYGQPYIVDYNTGRWCRIESNGYRFCWTP